MVLRSVGSAAMAAMRPLDGSSPIESFKIGAGPLGTHFESNVRSSRDSNRRPPDVDDRRRLLINAHRSRPDLGTCTPLQREKEDHGQSIAIAPLQGRMWAWWEAWAFPVPASRLQAGNGRFHAE